MNQLILIALIQALTQEVTLLEAELAQQQAIVATTTYTTPPMVIPLQQTQTYVAPIQTYVAPIPFLSSVQSTPNPTCNLKVTPDVGDNARAATVTWDSSNTVGTTGQITEGVYFGCGDSCSEYKMVAPQNVQSGNITGASGSQYVIFNWVDFNYPDKRDNNTKVELNIGGATCDTYVPAK